jgi:hypothetical protein
MFRDYPDQRITVSSVDPLRTGGRGHTVDINLVGPDLDVLTDYTFRLIERLRKVPGLVDVDTTLSMSKPELHVELDRARAADLGVTAESVASSLAVLVGGEPVSTFKDRDEQSDVWLRAVSRRRDREDVIADLRIPRRLYAATGLAPRPGSDEIAYAVYSERTGQGTVFLYNGRFSRPLFSGAGRFEDITWSPDGQLLLVPWQAADQWLFIPAEGQARVQANADIAGQFAPGEGEDATPAGGFPRVEGWCCQEEEPLPPPVDTGATDTGVTETGAETGG